MFECPGGSRGGDIQGDIQSPGVAHTHRLRGQDCPAVGCREWGVFASIRWSYG